MEDFAALARENWPLWMLASIIGIGAGLCLPFRPGILLPTMVLFTGGLIVLLLLAQFGLAVSWPFVWRFCLIWVPPIVPGALLGSYARIFVRRRFGTLRK